MKNGSKVKHTSGRVFIVLNQNIRRQFVRESYCELRNTKTGQSEFYHQSALGKYFFPCE